MKDIERRQPHGGLVTQFIACLLTQSNKQNINVCCGLFVDVVLCVLFVYSLSGFACFSCSESHRAHALPRFSFVCFV